MRNGVKYQLLTTYNNGILQTDRGVNMGVHLYSQDLQLFSSINSKLFLYSYLNVWEDGDNPFTENFIGGGVRMSFKEKDKTKGSDLRLWF